MVYNGNKCNCVHASETLLEKRWRINIDGCNALQKEHLLIWRTGLEDPICEKKRFLPPHPDLVALISFPGSGNTWLRHLLEQATGIYTGSVYTDKDMYNKGFLGEMEDSKSGRTLLVKDHIYTDKRISLFDYSSVVLLVRNPFKALVAEFNRRKSQNHVGFAKPEDFRSTDWSSYATSMAAEWLNTIAEVFRSGIPVRMVYYEDLLSHTPEEIEKLLKHIPRADDAFQTRKHCLDRNQIGDYKRPERVETTFFSAALVNFINYQVKRARTILLQSDCVTCKGIPLYEEESSDREATLGGMDDSRSVGNAVIGAMKVHVEN
ncbi:sialate:O-sulfotransferase 2-like [Ciona intestinalis]